MEMKRLPLPSEVEKDERERDAQITRNIIFVGLALVALVIIINIKLGVWTFNNL